MDGIALLSALLGVVLALLLHQALPPMVILIGGPLIMIFFWDQLYG